MSTLCFTGVSLPDLTDSLSDMERVVSTNGDAVSCQDLARFPVM